MVLCPHVGVIVPRAILANRTSERAWSRSPLIRPGPSALSRREQRPCRWTLSGRQPRGVTAIELSQEPFASAAETASAVVYCAGDLAYKLKKPVNLDFLDFTTRQARANACRRETELNQRYAPDVYLGVGEIRTPDGQVCDHLVVMRRMPADRRLSALARSGALAGPQVQQIARLVAAKHAAAARSARIAAQGSAEAVWGRWEENLSQVQAVAGRPVIDGTVATVRTLAREFIAGRSQLFQDRIQAGRILDGHGDLLADDIFCLDDGPRVLDCLDFDDRLRYVDGLDDAAFLAMDLERLGASQWARSFLDWYAEYSGDPAPSSLRHHYVAYRAFVRSKVAAIRSVQGDPTAAGRARQLADLSLRHLRAGAVTLVLVGGLPGTGKSMLAGAVGGELGWVVLNSDRIRKELAGVDPDEAAPSAFGTGIYTAAWTERSYAELLRRAAAALAMGESVVLDASWISGPHRTAAAEQAAAARARLVQLHCTVPAALAEYRLALRGPGVSDADGEIARRMAAIEDPWPGATAVAVDDVAATEPESGLSAILGQALKVIRPHGSEHVWRPSRPVMLPD